VARPKTHDDALRGTLLTKAAELAFEHGVAALTLRKVAAAANTSTTAVYSLFGNKDGLLDALYQEAAQRFAAGLADVGESADPVADLVRLGVAYRDYAVGNPNLYGLMFSPHPDLSAQRQAELSATFDALVAAVRRAQRAGGLRAAPAEQIALSCWGIAHGLVSVELAGTVPDGVDVAANYEVALRAVVDGWSVST
jgi:AcrR family transcriptional regulator